VSFDSYDDNVGVINCINRLSTVIASDDIQGIFVGSTLFDVFDIEHALNSLKSGKSSGADDLFKESIMYAHPSIVIHLKLLFNMICTHGFVPDAFGVGITVPVIKSF